MTPKQTELIKKHQIVGGIRTLYGHRYARSVQALFKAGKLSLIKVDDHRRGFGSWKEIDLNEYESISTYDELVKVDLNQDLTVTLHIDESTVSFYAVPSRRRASFHLSGDWWLIGQGTIDFAARIDAEFKLLVRDVRQAEIQAAEEKREAEIEIALLDGTYNK